MTGRACRTPSTGCTTWAEPNPRARGAGDAEKWGLVGRRSLAVDIGNGNGSSLSALTFGARGSPLNVLYSPDGEVLNVQLGAISRSQILQEFSPYLEG